MIKANELRIGNWVFMKGVAIPERMVTIGINDFKYAESEYMNPIPLTPEILQKCGFDVIDYRRGDGPSATANWRGLKVEFVYGYFRIWNTNYEQLEVKHLHELQNLYFALTKEELNVNL